MHKIKNVTRYLFGLLFVLAGANHFLNSGFYVTIMPSYLPWHLALVQLSGIIEIGLGGLLLFKNYAVIAAWGLIALLIAVFPANVYMATHPELFPGFNPVLLWLRLPLQAVLIAWAFWYTRRKRQGKAA